MIDERSRGLRRLILRMMEAGGRGHLGPAASLVEILRVLYDTWLRVYPDYPRSTERDRLVLSKGHGCLALYSILADKKFTNSQGVKRLYVKVYKRPPTALELKRAVAFLSNFAKDRQASWQALCQSLVSSNEFLYLK